MNGTRGFLVTAATTLFLMSSQGISQVSGKPIVSHSSTSQNMFALVSPPAAKAKPPKGTMRLEAAATTSATSWDWTIDRTYNVYFKSPAGNIVYATVLLPWYDNACPPFGDFAEFPRPEIDFYKQEGWVLVYRDFGDSLTAARGNPMFMLYNKYRGILRVFFWNATDSAYSYGIMHLTLTGPNPTSLLTFNSGTPQFSDQYDSTAGKGFSLFSPVQIIPVNWCYADFELSGYDQNIAKKKSYLSISVYGVDASVYDPPSFDYPEYLLFNESSFVSMETPEDALDTRFTRVDKELTALYTFYSTMRGLNKSVSQSAWYESDLDSVASAASPTSASWILKISSLAGPVKGLIGPLVGTDEFYPTFSIDMQDSVVMHNTVLTVLPRVSFPPIPVPGSLASADSVYPGSTLRYDLPLGIFNLNTEPTIGYCYKVKSFQANSGTRASYVYGSQYYGLDSPLQLNLNPNDGLTLIGESVSLLNDSTGTRTPYYNVSGLTDYRFSPLRPVYVRGPASQVQGAITGSVIEGPKSGLPVEIALQMKFTYQNSLFGKTDTVFILKTYPAKLVYDPSIADRVGGSLSSPDSVQTTPPVQPVPALFVLGNYPNPFNPTTNVEYQLKSTSRVNITVYNSLGQKVAILTNGVVSAGLHTAVFNGYGFASGVYFLRFIAQPQNGGKPIIQTDKMLLIK